MIYCSLEPELLSLKGLQPHDTPTAFAVVKSLLVHRDQVRRNQAKVPLTGEFLTTILDDLRNLPIKNPPLQKALREIIVELLSRQVILVPTGLEGTQITPDIVSAWVDSKLRELWRDAIVAAIFDLLITESYLFDKLTIAVATWIQKGLPNKITLKNTQLLTYLESKNDQWILPLLVHEHDWELIQAESQDWGNNLEVIIEGYARRHLGIRIDTVSVRRKFRFEKVCLDAICEENNPKIRQRLIEVIARRAYDCLLPHHNNERIESKKDVWRVYVKKTAPPVRIHYYFEGNDVVYTLYSNGTHDKDL